LEEEAISWVLLVGWGLEVVGVPVETEVLVGTEVLVEIEVLVGNLGLAAVLQDQGILQGNWDLVVVLQGNLREIQVALEVEQIRGLKIPACLENLDWDLKVPACLGNLRNHLVDLVVVHRPLHCNENLA
jgi:hypothetical protein